jgi:hypothetical protein
MATKYLVPACAAFSFRFSFLASSVINPIRKDASAKRINV